MQFHFLSFLINITSWLVVGFLIGRTALRLKKNTVNKSRFYFTILGSALIGGLLAQLSNGSPDFGISITNLIISGFAAMLAILLAFPAYAQLFMKLAKEKTAHNIKTIRVGMQVFRSK